MDEIHLVKLGSAENEEEWATAHFRFFVVTQNSLSQQRLLISRRDNGSSVATGQGLLGHNRAVRVETVPAHARPGGLGCATKCAHVRQRNFVVTEKSKHAQRARSRSLGRARTAVRSYLCHDKVV